MYENFIIGDDEIIEQVKTRVKATIGGHGSIMALSGESGLGKSYFLKYINGVYSENTEIQSVYVENQAPIGAMKVAQMQPFYPFANGIEQILSKDTGKAKKKFALNAGMTILSSLPVAGDFFYAVKELSKDWRQFKQDKVNTQIEISLADQLFDSIMQLSMQSPIIFLLDDLHWCDAQSIALLKRLAEVISDYAIQIVFTYKKSILQGAATPLLSFISEYTDNSRSNVAEEEFTPLTRVETNEFLKKYFPKIPNNGFDNWLFEKSMGLPGVIAEYLKYFQNFPERVQNFNPDNIEENEKFLPASLTAVFSETISALSDEERNILAACSGEGRIFSSTIVSGLMNTDILTCIKKLRAIQQKTGLIHSLGARNRYGIKTTVYEFTQTFYYDYFKNSLEYEENIALHGQIAALLKQHYNEAESEQIKAQIAPYLAAHSNESGDTETAKSMMLKTAEGAANNGDAGLAGVILSNLKEINLIGDDFSAEELNADNSTKEQLAQLFDEIRNGKRLITANSPDETPLSDDITTFGNIREVIMNNFNTDNFQYASNKAAIFYNMHFTDLNSSQKIEFLAMLIRLNTELGNFEVANQYADKAFVLTDAVCDPVSESFVLNSFALLKFEEGDIDGAVNILKQVAQNALSLPVEIKLVTLANISKIMKTYNPRESAAYSKAAAEIAKILQLNSISEILA